MQTCLNMYYSVILSELNVSMMFPELQKSKSIVINIMISELHYILICMTRASQSILTDARSGYSETPAQHIWVLVPFLYIKKGSKKKNPTQQTQRSFNLGGSTTELSGIPDCGGPPGMYGTMITTSTHNTLLLQIANNHYRVVIYMHVFRFSWPKPWHPHEQKLVRFPRIHPCTWIFEIQILSL